MQSLIDALPPPLLATLLVALCTGFAVGCAAAAERFHWSLAPEDVASAAALLALGSIVYAVALGLFAVNVQSRHDQVREAAGLEASRLGDLYRDLEGLPATERHRIQELVRRYTDAVVNNEWPAAGAGVNTTVADRALNEIGREIVLLHPGTPGGPVIHQALIADVDTVMDARRTRVLIGMRGMAAGPWAITVVGTMVTLWFAALFPLRWAHRVLALSLMATIFGLMLFLVVSLNLPMRGHLAVGPEAFGNVRATMDVGPLRP